MKKLLLGLVALAPFISKAQDTFTINGQIGTVSMPAKVYLAYRVGANQILDSAYVNKGIFTLKGPVTTPLAAKLVLDHTGTTFHDLRAAGEKAGLEKKLDVLNLFIDNGNITITGTDSVATAKISGSPINDDNTRLTSQLAIVNARAKKLTDYAATITTDPTPEFTAALQARLKPLQDERERTLQAFVKSNPNSYISLLALNSLGGPTADPAAMEPLYNGLSAELKQTDLGKYLATNLKELKVTAIGAIAPDFTQNDAAGKPVALSSFRGRYVLVDFWASWCGPCRAENPNVVNVFNKYKTKKFAILGVSLDDASQKGAWISAVEKDGLRWPQVSDLKGWQNAAAVLYNVHLIPQNFLIGPDGKIVAKNLRGADLENKLAEIFGKI